MAPPARLFQCAALRRPLIEEDLQGDFAARAVRTDLDVNPGGEVAHRRADALVDFHAAEIVDADIAVTL